MNNSQRSAPVVHGFAGYDNGHSAMQGATWRLFQNLDRLFLSWASYWNAAEYQFPATLPAHELNKIGYFKSFPQHLTLPVCLDADHGNLAEFAAGSVRDRDRAVLAVCLAKGEESARAGYPTELGCAHVEIGRAHV